MSRFAEAFTGGLVLPALFLAIMGWIVPRILSAFFPEGVRPLIILGCLAAFVMFALSAGMFLALYLMQDVPAEVLFADGWLPSAIHFGRLGLMSAMLWGPLLVLSVANLPRHWTKATW